MSAAAAPVSRDAAPAAATGRAGPRAAAVLQLQRHAGNRAVGAVLARSPTEVLNVELRQAPPRPKMRPAIERTTPHSMELAKEIDEVDKLSDDELIALRAQVAIDAARAGNDADWAAQTAATAAAGGGADAKTAASSSFAAQSAYALQLRKLEAIEYVADWRHLRARKADHFHYQDADRFLANQRANVRQMIQDRVKQTGSFDDALKGLPEDEREIQSIKHEAEQFRHEFTGEAWLNAERMLLHSQATMFAVLRSYGLPREQVEWGVDEITRGKSPEDAAQVVVDSVLKLPEEQLNKQVNAAAAVGHRQELASTVKQLKVLQDKVKELRKVAGGLYAKPGGQGIEEMNRARRGGLARAQEELAAAWLEAEREHNVLAAYRGDETDLDKVEIGRLDVPARETNEQMKEVLTEVLPKLTDNGRALYLLRHHGLSPIAMPPVVALTQATMFIPDGSIKAGVIQDMLAEERHSREHWFLTLAAWALAIITLLPTGGMSAAVLVPVGLASAGLSAYSALKIYERYERQKLLVNTDLDLSRALSNEQPSLRGFAMNLVAAGLEGFALFRLWRAGVEVRRLAFARQSYREALEELKGLIRDNHLSDALVDDVLKGTGADAKAGTKPLSTDPPGGTGGGGREPSPLRYRPARSRARCRQTSKGHPAESRACRPGRGRSCHPGFRESRRQRRPPRCCSGTARARPSKRRS